MTDEPVIDETSRVSMEWPTSLKERVREKVGARGLTEFVTAAVVRELENGSADLAVDARDARDLAQRLANVLATVVDNEIRLTFLGSAELPDWIDTRSWPNDVLARRADVVVAMDPVEPVVEEPEIDPVPEFKKVEHVTTTRVEPKASVEGVGTPEEPVVIPEGRINAMDGPKYAELQHVHSPDGRCLKNLFIQKGEDGKKHCPLILAEPVPAPVLPQPTGDNLFERLKQSGALVPANQIPKPSEPGPGPEPEPVATGTAEAAMQTVEAAVQQTSVEPVVAQTSGPDSGPLPPLPESSYAPDSVALEPPAPTGGPCPKCGAPLDGGLCWSCGYGA